MSVVGVKKELLSIVDTIGGETMNKTNQLGLSTGALNRF